MTRDADGFVPRRTNTPEEVFRAYLSRQELVSGGVVPPNWSADGRTLWYAGGPPDDITILQVDLASGEVGPMFDVAAVLAALTAATGRKPPTRGLPFDAFTPDARGGIEFAYAGSRWRFDPATCRVQRTTEVDANLKLINRAESRAERSRPKMWRRGVFGAGWVADNRGEVPEQMSPDGEWFASVQADNIVLRSTWDGRDRQLTSSGTSDIFWDIESSWFGRVPGRIEQIAVRNVNPWSPDSLSLLAYRRDFTGVYRIPRVHFLTAFEEVELVPYQKAGARMHRIEPVFIDVRSGVQIPVALPEIEDRYIQLLAWHPAGIEALLVVYNRDLTRVDVIAAHRETGAIRILLTECAPTAVKNHLDEVMGNDHGFHLLPDRSGFLWRSTRDGWSHLYRYDWDGQLVGQLTSGKWPVYGVAHIGGDGRVYFTAAIDTARPYDQHICRVSLRGGAVEQLTREKGLHSAIFSPLGHAFVDTHSSVDRPVRTDLVRADGTPLRMLSEMDISRFERLGYTPAEEFTVKAADGETELWGVMYKPHDFDPTRSYPVIESVYGGPQTLWAQRSFAIDRNKYLNFTWALAQLGYITICLDARGTPLRSKAFQDAVHGNWTVGVPDHAGAIRQLCARHSWMDAKRVGVMGFSWGGAFATWALLLASDVYHAAVASEPGYDPWGSTGYEPYLGLPQKNRAAYDAADPVKHASQLRGRLMIINGTRFTRTTGPAMKMTRALIEAGIDHEFVLVPDATHGFVGVEEDYVFMKHLAWFERHVKNRGDA